MTARYHSAQVAFLNPAINYYVDDVQRSVAFYVDNFGFVETFRTPKVGEPDHVELRLGEFVLGLAAKRAGTEMHGLPLGPGGNPRVELVLWTDDVDRQYAALLEQGVAGLSAPHDFLGTLRSAWVIDPEGNPVQLVMKR